MLLGYSIIAVPTGIVTASLQEAHRQQRHQTEGSKAHEQCPHCGGPLHLD
jgi:hypothetical protein